MTYLFVGTGAVVIIGVMVYLSKKNENKEN